MEIEAWAQNRFAHAQVDQMRLQSRSLPQIYNPISI